jgi:hypothetical protein
LKPSINSHPEDGNRNVHQNIEKPTAFYVACPKKPNFIIIMDDYSY